MTQTTEVPALVGSGNKTDELGPEAIRVLFEAFIRCRTTFDDLSNRAAGLGENLSAPVIAAHLTGKSCLSAQKHNVLSLPSMLACTSCHCLDLRTTPTSSNDLGQLGDRSAAGELHIAHRRLRCREDLD